MSRLAACLCGWLVVASTSPAAPQKIDSAKLPDAAAVPIDFARDIQPIFAKHCLACHGPTKQRGGVRLDDSAAAMIGGNSGPIILPGKATTSRLLIVVAGLDADVVMPPKERPPISKEEIGRIRAWIDQGAQWPKQPSTASALAASDHWAFQPIRSVTPPAAKTGSIDVRNDIDRFLWIRLEKERLAPSTEADPVTVIRRLHFDLLGLPPNPQEVDQFLAEYGSGASPESDKVWNRWVERLLNSPHYGERWGRHWLDLARYADSDGYEADRPRPYHWRYRDWVIDAVNRDMPFDQFTIEQLAGDLLPSATLAQKTATGFHRNTLTNREGGTDQEQFRVEACIDRVNTTAKVWLGLTLGCAQCHDHKYDPISQREYYQFFAFFNPDKEVDERAPLPSDDAARAGYVIKKADLEKHLAKLAKDDKNYAKAVNALADHVKKEPTPAYVPTLAAGKRATHVLIRGDFLRLGVKVEAGVPAVLPPLKAAGPPTRLDLARWLVASDNPLTTRVIVNWVWHHHFGRGLVATVEDFGTQGEKPSHPELLDHLAAKFIELKWSMKALHRYIVTSATYRQSSKMRLELANRDPLNILLARQSRIRFEAEIVRDNVLAVSGLLVKKFGGPSVRPPQPAGIAELTYAGSAKWVESKGEDRYRRGVYTFFQRTSPYPMLTMFDAPDANLSCVRRDRTNTPLQALTLLNDTTMVECAQALAKRIVMEKTNSATERLQHAFRLCLARKPSAQELEHLQAMYDEVLALCRASPKEAQQLAGKTNGNEQAPAELATWITMARMMMNLDECVTRE